MALSQLALDIYAHLRTRVPAPPHSGRLSYTDLCDHLHTVNRRYLSLTPDDRVLHFELGQLVHACQHAGHPPISALVVKFDSTSGHLTIPGSGYYEAAHRGIGTDYVDRVTAWAADIRNVERHSYPTVL